MTIKRKVMEALESPELLERLAAVEHDRWMRNAKTLAEQENISAARLARWREQCFMPYSDLSEEMKDYDRHEAENSLAVVRAAISMVFQSPAPEGSGE